MPHRRQSPVSTGWRGVRRAREDSTVHSPPPKLSEEKDRGGGYSVAGRPAAEKPETGIALYDDD